MTVQKFDFNQLISFLRVSDMGRSRHFYGEILGLPQVYERAGKVVILQATADSFIGLVPGELPAGTERSSAITLLVQDADAWWPRLQSAGVPNKGKPIFKDAFNIYVLYATDPDGYTVELMEMREPTWPYMSSQEGIFR